MFRSSYENADRIHVRFTLYTDGVAAISISTGLEWSEFNGIDLVASIARAQGWTLARLNTAVDRGMRIVSGTCNGAVRPSRTAAAATIHWPEILSALRSHGVRRAEIRVRTRGATSETDSPTGIQWVHVSQAGSPILAALVPTDAPVTAMHLRFGTTSADLRKATGLLLTVALAPFLVLLVARRWVVSRPGDPAAYQVYQRIRIWTPVCALLAWSQALVHGGGLAALMTFLTGVPSWLRLTLGFAAVLGAPLAVAPLLALISMPVDEVFRGTRHTRRTYILRALIFPALFGAPMLLLMLGLVLAPDATRNLMHGRDGHGGLLGSSTLAIVIGVGTVIGMRVMMVKSMKPSPLEQGPLVDSILDLCRRAEVSVSQVLIGHTEKERVANAFVSSSGTVMLTDFLVRRFTRAEVDAVVAHELAHLRLKHLTKRMWAMGAGILVWLALLVTVRAVVPRAAWSNVSYFTFWIVPALLTRPISRKHELEADAEAVRLTCEPRVFIQMLTKLAGLNTQPLKLGRVTEAAATHPGTLRRIRAVATANAISDDELSSLMAGAEEALRQPETDPALRSSGTGDTLAADGQADSFGGYILSPSGADSGLLFTPAARLRAQRPAILFGIVPGLGILLLAIPLINLISPSGTGWTAGVVAVGSMVIGFAWMFTVALACGFTSMRSFRPALEKKISGLYGLDLSRELYVGLSPGAVVRSYGGETSWDIGFMLIEPGRLSYLGEKAAFAITPDQVVSVDIRTHGTALTGRFPRVFVTWRDAATQQERTVNLECRDARSFKVVRRMSAELKQRIEAWRQMPALGKPAPLPAGGALNSFPPEPDRVFGGALPALSQATPGRVAVAFLVAMAVMVAATFAYVRLLGKETANEPLLRFGTIAVTVTLFRSVLSYLNRRTAGKQSDKAVVRTADTLRTGSAADERPEIRS